MGKVPHKILIIDDEEDVARLAARRIRSWGHDVICLYEGGDAVPAIRRERPALVLLDIRLPDMSGIDVYRRIRGDRSMQDVPIVFFSAHSSQEEYCLKTLGAQGFIRKPYDPKEFRDTISRLLGREVDMTAPRKRILVVEDDGNMQALLKKKLNAGGYDCVGAQTVEVALEELEELKPNLVILDLGLPDASGTAFLRGAKDRLPPGSKLPPVIVLSGYGDKEIVDYALGEGALRFLTKPLDSELLLAAINDCLSA